MASRRPQGRYKTPDEMYLGTAGDVARSLRTQRAVARTAPLAANRAARCEICTSPQAGAEPDAA